MPRKHPVLGVPVMTPAEFWKSEADHEGLGREPGELMQEAFDEIEADNRRASEELRANALDRLREAWSREHEAWRDDRDDCSTSPTRFVTRRDDAGQWLTVEVLNVAGEEPPEPVRLVEVREAVCSGGYSGTERKIVAVCETADGRRILVTWLTSNTSGSYYQPPDHDESYSWKTV